MINFGDKAMTNFLHFSLILGIYSNENGQTFHFVWYFHNIYSFLPIALPASTIKLRLVLGNKKGAGETFCHLSQTLAFALP